MNLGKSTVVIMFKGIFFCLVLLSGILNNPEVRAQDPYSTENAYNSFDELVGLENTNLFNGKEYIEQHVVRNQMHKYFLSSDYQNGMVVYDGLPYFDIPMKYNVHDDLLLVKLRNSEGERSFQLHKSKIDQFEINGHLFLNIEDKLGSDAERSGFYEVLQEAHPFVLLKKHFKKGRKYLDRNFTYFEFENDDAEYFFEHKENFQVLISRRRLAREFPNHRKELRQFYNQNNSMLKRNPDEFHVALFEELKEFSSNSNHKEE